MMGPTTVNVGGDARMFRAPGVAAIGMGLGLALVFGVAGCHKTAQPVTSDSPVGQNAGDPADANMVLVSGSAAVQPAQVLGQNSQYQPQQQGEDYSQQPPAPIERVAPGSGDQSYEDAPADNGDDAANQRAMDLYNADLTGAQSSEPPPPLPDYDQPPAPDPDYLWTPGYWAWGPGGYYWVPGAWVAAPYVGALWTPGYWGFVGGYYRFHHGYWGLHIGFYGGIDYGFGYIGHGYYGGYWNGGHFFYNSAVTRVNANAIHNVYVHNDAGSNRVVNRTSFDGGHGGVAARPLPAEVSVMHEQRNAPMASQVQVQREAAQNKGQFYNQNHGRPATVVAAHPVVADRTPPPALPRVATPTARNETSRPGQPQTGAPAAHPQPAPQTRNAPEAAAQGRENRPETQPNRPQPQYRPDQQIHPQARPAQPAPQSRPTQPSPQPRAAQEARPVQQQPEARPVAPRAAPQPRPEARPAPPASHPQPQARPEGRPEERPAPPAHEDEKPHRSGSRR